MHHFVLILTHIQEIIFWSLINFADKAWDFHLDLAKRYGRFEKFRHSKPFHEAICCSNISSNWPRSLKLGNICVLTSFDHTTLRIKILRFCAFSKLPSKFESITISRWIKNTTYAAVSQEVGHLSYHCIIIWSETEKYEVLTPDPSSAHHVGCNSYGF